jgi:hypothetical protein
MPGQTFTISTSAAAGTGSRRPQREASSPARGRARAKRHRMPNRERSGTWPRLRIASTTAPSSRGATGCLLEEHIARARSATPFLSGQRTAVKQRPHQEITSGQVATSEPVVLHHGRQGGGDCHDEARPSASTAVRWAAYVKASASLRRRAHSPRNTRNPLASTSSAGSRGGSLS